jgi:hypothetical protein
MLRLVEIRRGSAGVHEVIEGRSDEVVGKPRGRIALRPGIEGAPSGVVASNDLEHDVSWLNGLEVLVAKMRRQPAGIRRMLCHGHNEMGCTIRRRLHNHTSTSPQDRVNRYTGVLSARSAEELSGTFPEPADASSKSIAIA